jgi:hypothetical protein
MAIDTSQPHVQFLFVYGVDQESRAEIQSKLDRSRTMYEACKHVSSSRWQGYFASIPTATEMAVAGVFFLLYGVASSYLFETCIDRANCRIWYRVGHDANMKSKWHGGNAGKRLPAFNDFASLLPST